MKTMRWALLLIAALILSCNSPAGPENKFDFENLPGNYVVPSGKEILSVTNLSNFNASISFTYTSPPPAPARNKASLDSAFSKNDGILLKDLERASVFNATVPVARYKDQRRSIVPDPMRAYVVGNTEQFWVETSVPYNFVQRTATLRSIGSTCYIWVDDSELSIITVSKAQALSNKFDQIYPLATQLLGYEYGGGPGGHGGIDRDQRIHILVYNIVETNVLGYFWDKDPVTVL